MKFGIALAAWLLMAAPAVAQNVRAGVEAWQKGDYPAAVTIWTPLAAKGDADAAFNLGQAYRLGKGVPIDLARAQRYLEQAARKGHVDAATTLGVLLFQNGNRAGAMRWLKKAAEAGEERAMLLYGTALFNGDGVARDPILAYAFVSRAAAKGLGAAQATLADLDQTIPSAQREKGLAMAEAMLSPKAVPAPKAAAAPAPKPAAPPVVAAPNASGGWRIQLGAFGQRATAEALFARLRNKVGGRQAYYVAAGKVIRLQVGPYDSRAAATAACAGLGACFVVPAR
ncbi:MAG TPA: SPOR domain-containing protein [Sphingomicrobium sp.]|nr:SPOR domain-containing protein [Sphingomicrobium sp.]